MGWAFPKINFWDSLKDLGESIAPWGEPGGERQYYEASTEKQKKQIDAFNKKVQEQRDAEAAATQNSGGSPLMQAVGEMGPQPEAPQAAAAQAAAPEAAPPGPPADPYAGLWAMRERAGLNKDWGAESDAIYNRSIDALNQRSGDIVHEGDLTSDQVKALYDYVGSTLPGAQAAVGKTTDESVGKTNEIYNKLQGNIGNTAQQIAGQIAKVGGKLDAGQLGELAAGSQPFLDVAKSNQATGVKHSTDVGQASQNYLQQMVGNVNAEGAAAAAAPLSIAEMKAADLQMRMADVESEKAKARYNLERDTAKETMNQMLAWDQAKAGGREKEFEQQLKLGNFGLEQQKVLADAGKLTGKAGEDLAVSRAIPGFGEGETDYANQVWARAIADQGAEAQKGDASTDKRNARQRAMAQLLALDPTNVQRLGGLNKQAIGAWFDRRNEY